MKKEALTSESEAERSVGEDAKCVAEDGEESSYEEQKFINGRVRRQLSVGNNSPYISSRSRLLGMLGRLGKESFLFGFNKPTDDGMGYARLVGSHSHQSRCRLCISSNACAHVVDAVMFSCLALVPRMRFCER